MAADLGAFGQYSMILSDGRDPLSLQQSAVALGGGGFLGATQLVFWKGRYLVQVNLTDEGDDADEAAMRAAAREALPRFGERIAAALEGRHPRPRRRRRASRPRGSCGAALTYLANSAFGAERTGAAWVGHYRARGQLPLPPRGARREGTPDEARAAFTALRGAARATAVSGLGDEAFSVRGADGELGARGAGGQSRCVVVADPAGPGLTAPTLAAKQARLRAALSQLALRRGAEVWSTRSRWLDCGRRTDGPEAFTTGDPGARREGAGRAGGRGRAREGRLRPRRVERPPRRRRARGARLPRGRPRGAQRFRRRARRPTLRRRPSSCAARSRRSAACGASSPAATSWW